VIESVQIYNASGVKIAQGVPTAHQVIFNNQDIRLTQGSHVRYMTITPRKVGYNQATISNISYQLQLSITRAMGLVSTEQVVVSTSNQLSDSIQIRPFLFSQA
jgi:predicted P-loop ATPase/GTPase